MTRSIACVFAASPKARSGRWMRVRRPGVRRAFAAGPRARRAAEGTQEARSRRSRAANRKSPGMTSSAPFDTGWVSMSSGCEPRGAFTHRHCASRQVGRRCREARPRAPVGPAWPGATPPRSPRRVARAAPPRPSSSLPIVRAHAPTPRPAAPGVHVSRRERGNSRRGPSRHARDARVPPRARRCVARSFRALGRTRVGPPGRPAMDREGARVSSAPPPAPGARSGSGPSPSSRRSGPAPGARRPRAPRRSPSPPRWRASARRGSRR